MQRPFWFHDVTNTFFESDPPFEDKRQFGHSRDQRRDCVQVVIALVVTPDGFPLAYEVMAGNTADNTTLADFLTQIEDQYGRSDRVWIMDRGIPTEHTLEAMREGDAPVRYLVGTPKGRLTRLEKSFLGHPDFEWRDLPTYMLPSTRAGRRSSCSTSRPPRNSSTTRSRVLAGAFRFLITHDPQPGCVHDEQSTAKGGWRAKNGG